MTCDGFTGRNQSWGATGGQPTEPQRSTFYDVSIIDVGLIEKRLNVYSNTVLGSVASAIRPESKSWTRQPASPQGSGVLTALPLRPSIDTAINYDDGHAGIYQLLQYGSRICHLDMKPSNGQSSRGHDSNVGGRQPSDDDEDSDEEASVTSEVTFNRLSRAPALPSVSSSASIKHITEKLAAFARARRKEPTVPAVDRIGPQPRPYGRTAESQLPAEAQQRIKSPTPSRAGNPGLHRIFREGHESPKRLVTIAQTIPHTGEIAFQDRSEPDTAESETLRHDNGIQSSELSAHGEDDTEYWTEEDEADKDLDQGPDEIRRITTHWHKLRDHRDTLKNTFQNIRRERVTLRDIRQHKDAAYKSLRLAIQEVLPRDPLLGRLFQEAQRADLTYQEAETNFDDLIDELEEGEAQLELEERRFYTAFAESDASTDTETSRPASRDTLRGIRGHRTEDIHPLFEELREAFSELQLAKEDQTNLIMRQRMISTKLKQQVTEEDVEFLEDFGTLQKRTRDEIDRWTRTANRLEKECREKNLIPKNTPYQQEGFGFYPVFLDDIYLEEPALSGEPPGRGSKTLADPQFSILLSNPTHLLSDPLPQTAEKSLRMAVSLPAGIPKREKFIEDAKKEFGIESLLDSSGDEDKRAYINRWLLHRLRQSAMEVELLSTCFRSFLKILDLEQWQRDVLFFWSRDATTWQPAGQYFSTESTNFVSTRTSPRSSLHSRRASLNAG